MVEGRTLDGYAAVLARFVIYLSCACHRFEKKTRHSGDAMKRLSLQAAQAADTRMYCWCANRKHRHLWAQLAYWISKSGDGPLYAVLGLLLAWLEPEQGPYLFMSGLIAYAIDVPAYLLMKNRIKRPRPFVQLNSWHYIVPSDQFSFPSGHTAAAMVWAVLISATYSALAAPALLWALAVGMSRVFLGVHYPGDILAGLVLGTSAALMGLSLAAIFI